MIHLLTWDAGFRDILVPAFRSNLWYEILTQTAAVAGCAFVFTMSNNDDDDDDYHDDYHNDDHSDDASDDYDDGDSNNKTFEMNEKETNLYLQRRAAKIARNQALLRELGLAGTVAPQSAATCKTPPLPTTTTKTTLGRPSFTSQRGDGKELKPLKNDKDKQQQLQRHNVVRLRRSPRIRKDKVTEQASATGKRGRTIVADGKGSLIDPKIRKKPNHGRSRQQSEDGNHETSFPPSAARGTMIHVQQLIDRYLGVKMKATGKAFVIESVSGKHGLSFNKYCGVQEWKNDALFLWVNLGQPESAMNDFIDGGRQVSIRKPIWKGTLLSSSNTTNLFLSLSIYLICGCDISCSFQCRWHGLEALECMRILEFCAG